MKKISHSLTLGAGIMGLILTAGVMTAFAAGDDSPKGDAATPPDHVVAFAPPMEDDATTQKLADALEKNDYEAWKSIITERHQAMLEEITSQDHYDHMLERYQEKGVEGLQPRMHKGFGKHMKNFEKPVEKPE